MNNFGNSRNFFEKIVSSSRNTEYQIKLDNVPAEVYIYYEKRRNIMITIDKEEEEKECNCAVDDLQQSTKKEAAVGHMSEFLKEFMSIEYDLALSVEIFYMVCQDETNSEKTT